MPTPVTAIVGAGPRQSTCAPYCTEAPFCTEAPKPNCSRCKTSGMPSQFKSASVTIIVDACAAQFTCAPQCAGAQSCTDPPYTMGATRQISIRCRMSGMPSMFKSTSFTVIVGAWEAKPQRGCALNMAKNPKQTKELHSKNLSSF